MPQPKPPKYDPSIQSLLAQTVKDWGVPEENRQTLFPYGYKPLDKALYGIDIVNGELIVVQGQEKNRKTTFVVNVLINAMTSELPKHKPFTVIDTLESGMNPKRYRDTLIANFASRLLIRMGHRPQQLCPKCNGPCKELHLSPEFLRFRERSEEQQTAIDTAMAHMATWPLHIYGANPDEGDTRNLITSVDRVESRWMGLIREKDAKVFVSDHLQQYYFGEGITDYEKQMRTISAIGRLTASYGIVTFLLSQVSLTSVRENRSGLGSVSASGGKKAAAEATVILGVNYQSGDGLMQVKIEDSRKAGRLRISIPIDDVSGASYGEATLYEG